MRARLLFSVCILFTVISQAQQIKIKNKKFDIENAAQVNVAAINEDWSISIQNLEMPVPGGNSQREILLALKEEARKKYPLKKKPASLNEDNAPRSNYSTGMLRNFEGNVFNGSVPNDNDLAISNAGILVSVINTTIYMFDVENDTLLKNISLSSFTSSLGLTGSKYDPKIVYDPEENRFIIVILNGTTYQTSKIIVGFSQSGDPTGTWNLYALPGSPISDLTWSDYPVIGINNKELFIGINTFTNGSTNNSGFTQSCFWQINKFRGYYGDTLRTKYHYDILPSTIKAIFNITPIKGGLGLYGPHMYLLSNRNLAIENDTIFLMKVTDVLEDSASELILTTLISDKKYFLPPSARQIGLHTFDTNDSRILGGFLENGKIQFVQSCMDTTSGFAGIYHGFISYLNTTPAVTANIFSDTLLDLGFPNISSTMVATEDDEAIITFNHTAPTVWAGFSAISYNSFNLYSPIFRIKDGFNYVNLISGYYERWGDYSGSQSRYNHPGKVWTAGTFGQANKTNGTWIAEVYSPLLTSKNELSQNEKLDIKVFPNPTQELFTLDFYLSEAQMLEINVYTVDGKLVKTLLLDKVKKGNNQFTFSGAQLKKGIYILTVKTDKNQVIAQKKISKI